MAITVARHNALQSAQGNRLLQIPGVTLKPQRAARRPAWKMKWFAGDLGKIAAGF
jgi:hypothetical protein